MEMEAKSLSYKMLNKMNKHFISVCSTVTQLPCQFIHVLQAAGHTVEVLPYRSQMRMCPFSRLLRSAGHKKEVFSSHLKRCKK